MPSSATPPLVIPSSRPHRKLKLLTYEYSYGYSVQYSQEEVRTVQ